MSARKQSKRHAFYARMRERREPFMLAKLRRHKRRIERLLGPARTSLMLYGRSAVHIDENGVLTVLNPHEVDGFVAAAQ